MSYPIRAVLVVADLPESAVMSHRQLVVLIGLDAEPVIDENGMRPLLASHTQTSRGRNDVVSQAQPVPVKLLQV